jgi:hypothetical protein
MNRYLRVNCAFIIYDPRECIMCCFTFRKPGSFLHENSMYTHVYVVQRGVITFMIIIILLSMINLMEMVMMHTHTHAHTHTHLSRHTYIMSIRVIVFTQQCVCTACLLWKKEPTKIIVHKYESYLPSLASSSLFFFRQHIPNSMYRIPVYIGVKITYVLSTSTVHYSYMSVRGVGDISDIRIF